MAANEKPKREKNEERQDNTKLDMSNYLVKLDYEKYDRANEL